MTLEKKYTKIKKSTTAAKKKDQSFTAEEKTAMKERAKELKDAERISKNRAEGEKAGLKVEFKKMEEFLEPMNEMRDLKKTFQELMPSRQRDYLLYFSAPKQSKTRVSRIEKSIQKIFEGKGLNDTRT